MNRVAARWLLALVVAVAVPLVACSSGGGSSSGDNVETLNVDQKGLDLVFQDLDGTIVRVRAGDLDGALALFIRRLHAFTHVLEAEMRVRFVGPVLESDLYDAVTAIDLNLVRERDPALLAQQGERVRDLMSKAAAALGYRLPATTSPSPAR